VVKNEAKIPVPPPQFAIHHTDPTTILIEAIIPTDKPASFEDIFDVYSKKETTDDEWTIVYYKKKNLVYFNRKIVFVFLFKDWNN